MADFDSRLPVRAAVTDVIVQVADAATLTINPAKEDGNLLAIKTQTDQLTFASTRLLVDGSGVTQPVSSLQLPATLGQLTMAGSLSVVIASDQTPIPVSVTGSSQAETVIYSTGAAIASNLTHTQTYTPVSAVELDRIDVSASGQLKAEIKWGTTGAEATKAVLFTSKGDLNGSYVLANPVAIAVGMSVVVILTNKDNQAMDIYSSIQVHP